ncbi:MAG: FAD-dependent oxidoreductase [archaeon]|jgi:glutamate synthase (NADPH/NADH) small chain
MTKIAIIGSGPAGIACAKSLVKKAEVTVFDELSEFGGMLAYGIPEFRLPLSQIKQNTKQAKSLGIKFVRKKIESIKELLIENNGEFDFVVIAIGAGDGSKLGIPGEENEKILDALDFLKKAKLQGVCLVKDNEKVALIGGGNSAMDAARLAKHCGADITIIYRRTESEMPAFGNELAEAKKDGVKFDFLKGPISYENSSNGKIIVNLAVMKLGEKDASGRPKPIDSGERITQEFDKILLAVGQKNNIDWLIKDEIKCEWGKIIVNETHQTNNKNVFACGDCVTGAKNIATATVEGLNTAKEILKLIE